MTCFDKSEVVPKSLGVFSDLTHITFPSVQLFDLVALLDQWDDAGSDVMSNLGSSQSYITDYAPYTVLS